MMEMNVGVLGKKDGMADDSVQPNIAASEIKPKVIRAIRFMLLLILVKQRRVKHIV